MEARLAVKHCLESGLDVIFSALFTLFLFFLISAPLLSFLFIKSWSVSSGALVTTICGGFSDEFTCCFCACSWGGTSIIVEMLSILVTGCVFLLYCMYNIASSCLRCLIFSFVLPPRFYNCLGLSWSGVQCYNCIAVGQPWVNSSYFWQPIWLTVSMVHASVKMLTVAAF